MTDDKKAEKADDKKDENSFDHQKTKYPSVLPIALCVAMVAICGYAIFDTATAGASVDDRSVSEMTWDVMSYLRRKDHKQTGDFTKDSLKGHEKNVTSLMQKMQLVHCDNPEEPEEPVRPESITDIAGWERYRVKLKNYKYLKKTLTKRRGLCKKNNETRDKYVFVSLPNLPGGLTQEERGLGAAKFLYFENLHSYMMQRRYFRMASWFYQAMKMDEWKRQLGWLATGFEAYKKTIDPPSENLNKKGLADWNRKVFRDYLTKEYLGLELDTPRWVDGTPIRTWDGTTLEDVEPLKAAKASGDKEAIKAAQLALRQKGKKCYLFGPLAEAVTRANQRMHDAGKGEIYPFVCTRNVLHQAVLWVTAGNGDSLERVVKVAVNMPGKSNHFGSAMDLTNYKQAQPYLAVEAGMLCDFIDNDEGHCSVGEVNLDKHKGRKWRLDIQAMGKDAIDVILDAVGK